MTGGDTKPSNISWRSYHAKNQNDKKKVDISVLLPLSQRVKICCDDQAHNGCGKTSCQSCKSKSNISNCTWATVVHNRKTNSMELEWYLWQGKVCDHDAGFNIWGMQLHAYASAHTLNVREVLKKACIVWLKKLQGVRQIARLKQQRFLSFTIYITERSWEKIMCIYLLFDWFSGENCIVFTFSLHKGWQTSTD